MPAKETTALQSLFVRIPSTLKKRLARSAWTHGTSLSKEVARLLGEQLPLDLPSDVMLSHLKMQCAMQSSQLKMLEHSIIGLADKVGSREGQRQLRELGESLKANQARRLQVRENIAAESSARLEAQAAARAASPFAPLIAPASASKSPGQLEVFERRRANLLAVLSSSPHGTKTRVARAVGKTPAWLSHFLAVPGSKQHRSISASTARSLEAALGLKERDLERLARTSLDVQAHRVSTAVSQIRNRLKR